MLKKIALVFVTVFCVQGLAEDVWSATCSGDWSGDKGPMTVLVSESGLPLHARADGQLFVLDGKWQEGETPNGIYAVAMVNITKQNDYLEPNRRYKSSDGVWELLITNYSSTLYEAGEIASFNLKCLTVDGVGNNYDE